MTAIPANNQPIGVYDSGVGGLSVLKAIRAILPKEDMIYFADQAKVPYGDRSLTELRALGVSVTDFLLSMGCKAIVIACNTASAASLRHLRELHPEIPVVGMEPAVKPAAEQTNTGKVGVLATPSTFQGELYASVVERFASDVEIFQETCPGLVSQIENGYVDTPKTRRILEAAIIPLLDKQVDTLVMGCTHFPFVIPLIQRITSQKIRVIDPAPAVARQLVRVLQHHGIENVSPDSGRVVFFTTGNPLKFKRVLENLTDFNENINALMWQDDKLVPVEDSL